MTRAHCCCPDDDAEACLSRRCGPSTDWDGSPEQCSCVCHEELRRELEDDDFHTDEAPT